jgi:Spy/CpxP family protein refolding chaperone
MVMGRLANHLGLTEDQKTQARTIFQQSAEAAKPIHDRMRDAQKALAEAAKANAPVAEIDRLSQDVGALAGQLAASRTKAFAQFYSILTQEQKDKLESVQDRFMNGGIGPGAFGKRGWGQARQGRS